MRAVTSIPLLAVEIDGAPIAPGSARSITALRVRQRLSAPTLCELTFTDLPLMGGESGVAVPGQSLRIAVRGESDPLFVGQVTAVEFSYGGHSRCHGARARV